MRPARSSHKRRRTASLVLLLLCVYVALLVFARFNLIPVFSKAILLPFTALEWVLEKFVAF